MFKSTDTNTSANLRGLVLALTPDDIGISRESFAHPVWGMVMEAVEPEGPFSLVALADGSSSLYFNGDGDITGGEKHESVKEASAYLLTGAQHFYMYAEKVDEYPSPSEGEVLFYFLTFDGVLLFRAVEEKLKSPTNELANLYQAAHGLISELRKTEEK